MSRFNEIREKFHKEKNTPGLTSLPSDFYSKSFEEAKLLEERAKSTMDSNAFREYESMMSMLKRLYWIRIQKIVLMALNLDEKPEGLLKEEAVVYEKIKNNLNEARNNFTCEKIKQKDTIRVQILSDLPEFVGSDCRNYGPFNKETMIELPKNEAEILIKQNVAKMSESN